MIAQRKLERITAAGLGIAVAFAIAALGGTEQWARTIMQMIVLSLGSVWVGRMAAGVYLPRIRAAAVLLWAVPAWGVCQALMRVSVYSFVTWNAVVDAVTLALAFTLALHGLASKETREPFLRGLLLFVFVLSLIADLQNFTEPGKIYWLIAISNTIPFGPFINRDHYTVLIELVLPIGLWYAAEHTGTRRLAYAGLSAALVASAVLAASRAGCALVLAEMLVIPLLTPKGPAPARAKWVLPLAAALTAAVIGIMGWERLANRLHDADPLRGRRELFISAARMTRERPWTGSGMGTFETAYPAYALFDNGFRVDHAHNDWLEWAATGGLPLIAMEAGALLFALRGIVRRRWAVGILAVYAHALVDFPFEIPALALATVVLMGAALGARE